MSSFPQDADTVGRWTFNQTLAEASGLAGADFTVGAGLTAFAPVAPGLWGLRVGQNAMLTLAGHVEELAITGPVTLEALIVQTVALGNGTEVVFASHGQEGEDEASNTLYELNALGSNLPPLGTLRAAWEGGAGVDKGFSSARDLGNLGVPHYLAMTRDADGVGRLYINAELVHETFPGNPASGGTSGRLTVGARHNAIVPSSPREFMIYGLRVSGAQRTDEQVAAVFNAVLGDAFGTSL